jgi:hypothetical protein
MELRHIAIAVFLWVYCLIIMKLSISDCGFSKDSNESFSESNLSKEIFEYNLEKTDADEQCID